MSIKDNGGPAFPETCGDQIVPGMTLRDYFAAKAMQGFAAERYPGWESIERLAQVAYEWADAMLAERAK